MKPVHALILVGAALGVYYASTLDTEPNDNAEGGLFDWLPEIIRTPLQDGFGFIKTGMSETLNVLGEPFGGYWELKPSTEIINFIQKHEGYSLVPYETQRGNGDWTIGRGHKIDKKREPELMSAKLTAAQVEELFNGDLFRKNEAPLMKIGAARAVHQYVKGELTQGQFDALVSLVFNAGPYSKGAGSVQEIFALANAGKHIEAAGKIRVFGSAQWVKMPGLKTRRAYEADLYRSASFD